MAGVTDEEYTDTLAFADRMEMRRLELDKQHDREVSLRDRDVQVEKQKTKRARWEALAVFIIGLFVTITALGLSYIIWQGNKGPGAGEELTQDFKQSCIENGGTYLSDTNGGKCIIGPGNIQTAEEAK